MERRKEALLKKFKLQQALKKREGKDLILQNSTIMGGSSSVKGRRNYYFND